MHGISTAPKSEIYLSSKTYGENKKSKCGRRYLKHINDIRLIFKTYKVLLQIKDTTIEWAKDGNKQAPQRKWNPTDKHLKMCSTSSEVAINITITCHFINKLKI